MKKLNEIFKNKYLWWIFLSLVTIVLFIPALNIKFWWVDDGKDILIARQIVSSFRSLDFKALGSIFFEGNGRLRIIYWVYQTLEYLVGAINPSIHFAVHFSVIFITSIFIFETVRIFTRSNFAGLFSGLLFLLSPINTENIFRLGPVEPILGLFVAASLYFLFKKRLFLSVLFLLLASYSKETGFVIWLPIFFLYLFKRLIYKKRDILIEKYCIWGLIFLVPILTSTVIRRTGYSTNYEFAIPSMIRNFSSYLEQTLRGFAPFPRIFILTYLIRIMWSFKKGKLRKESPSFIEQGVFILVFLAFVLVQSPWKYVLERYLMPATVGLVIFLGIELKEIMKLLPAKLKVVKIGSFLFISYLVIAAGQNIIRIYIQGEKVAFETNSIQSMITYIAENSPKNGKVLLNFITGDSTIELVNETGHLLEILYNRSDISASYLNIESIDPDASFIIGYTNIRARYSEKVVENEVNYSSKTILVTKRIFPVFTTPDNLAKQVAKKIFRNIIYKEPFNLDGIYTQYIGINKWSIYKLKAS